jgi:hypothetical protein
LIPRAPSDACLIKYKFAVYPDEQGGDYGYSQHFFDYVGAAGEEKWFVVNETLVKSKLNELCLNLRKLIKEISGDLWHSMEFVIDMREQRFEVNFDYNPRTPGEIA